MNIDAYMKKTRAVKFAKISFKTININTMEKIVILILKIGP
jgi:hypothetical protein